MSSLKEQALQKEAELKKYLQKFKSIAIAYSGGVDSTYLASVTHDVLGERCVLLIADTPSFPREELKEALELAKQQEWNVSIIYPNEFRDERFLKNDSHRCYYCKSELFKTMIEFTKQNRIETFACGENADDLLDTTRTGKLAIKEFGVITPLSEIGMSKQEIRILSEIRHLPTADKPSFACLSSRIPTGTPITIEDLKRIENAEKILKSLGFKQYRVRNHKNLARIEVEVADLTRLISEPVRSKVLQELKELGYRFVTVDIAGYRTGSTAVSDGDITR